MTLSENLHSSVGTLSIAIGLVVLPMTVPILYAGIGIAMAVITEGRFVKYQVSGR